MESRGRTMYGLQKPRPFNFEEFDPLVAEMVEQEMQMNNMGVQSPANNIPTPNNNIPTPTQITGEEKGDPFLIPSPLMGVPTPQMGGEEYQMPSPLNQIMNNMAPSPLTTSYQDQLLGDLLGTQAPSPNMNTIQQLQQQLQMQQIQLNQQQQQFNTMSMNKKGQIGGYNYNNEKENNAALNQQIRMQLYDQLQYQTAQNINMQSQQQLKAQQLQTQSTQQQLQTQQTMERNTQPFIKKEESPTESKVVSIKGAYTNNMENTRSKKRKKHTRVRKACLACRKSHVGCDENRPCKRCLKKNIPCVDSESQMEDEESLLNIPKNRTELEKRDEYIVNRLAIDQTLAEQLNILRNTNKTNQKLISHVLNEISMQNLEINYLKNHLETRPRLISTLYHKVPPGPWDKFANSKWDGVFVFTKQESVLLAFNACMANWFRIPIDELKGRYETFASLKNAIGKNPKPIQKLVSANREKTIFLNCELEVQKGTYPVSVSIHILPHLWWIHINYAPASSYIDPILLSNTPITKLNCPMDEDIKKAHYEKGD